MADGAIGEGERFGGVLFPRRRTSESLYWQFGKRAFDVALSLAVLPIVAVLVAILGLAVWCEGGRPFYLQERIGRDGKPFWMLKLRSMVIDAEARLAEHLASDPEARREWDHHQKLVNDPRTTRLGRFIRRTSLDELPQFLNVLRGDMSLIGPRPFMADQTALYPGSLYYSMRPGLSGAWQISERSASSFAARAEYDDAYYRGFSFAQDMSILVGTLRVLMRATGS